MDIFMIVMICVIGVILLITNVYLLAYYCHPDDRGFGTDLFAKGVVIFGMVLVWIQVLLFPLDVSNARSFGLDFRMDILWEIVYMVTGIFILVIIPLMIYWYEADEDWSCCDKIKYSFCYLFATIIVTLALLVITYAFLSKAHIPITKNQCSILFVENSNNQSSFNVSGCDKSEDELEIAVSFPIFVIGFMSFFSWIFFSFFGGIGIPALPLDLFYDFCTRPKRRSLEEMLDVKEKILLQSQKVKAQAMDLKDMENEGYHKNFFLNSNKRKYNDALTKLRASTFILDKEHKMYNIQTGLNDKLVCHYYLGLILGILFLICSVVWFLHIVIYHVIVIDSKPAHPFLNNFLTALVESGVGFIATAILFAMCLYLLLATIKGNIKFGVRIFCCWSIHPMIKDGTYMNSFLFNILVMLLTSVSVTQFCANSFREYGSMTDLELIFSLQIKYLMFFKYFYRYNVFEYILLGMMLLSTIYLLCRRKDINSLESLYVNQEKEEKQRLK